MMDRFSVSPTMRGVESFVIDDRDGSTFCVCSRPTHAEDAKKVADLLNRASSTMREEKLDKLFCFQVATQMGYVFLSLEHVWMGRKNVHMAKLTVDEAEKIGQQLIDAARKAKLTANES